MPQPDPLAKLGKFMMENLRDAGLAAADRLLHQAAIAPALLPVQQALSGLSASQQEAVRAAITHALDTALHDFLFALQEKADFGNDWQLLVDGQPVAALSDGLAGEAYGTTGWQAQFSKFDAVGQPIVRS